MILLLPDHDRILWRHFNQHKPFFRALRDDYFFPESSFCDLDLEISSFPSA